MTPVTSDAVRRSLRTMLGTAVALAGLVPLLVEAGVILPERWPWMASLVFVAGAVTRVMAIPAVNVLLGRWLGPGWTVEGTVQED